MLFSASRVRFSRIPETGYKSTATFKWATYTFWYVLDPIFRRHFQYHRRKVQLDRALEKNSILTNSVIGVILGVTVYVGVLSHLLFPLEAGTKEHTLQENAREVLTLMGCDTTKELPAFQLMRVKRELIGKLHAVADLAEVRRQREEVERLKCVITELERQKEKA